MGKLPTANRPTPPRMRLRRDMLALASTSAKCSLGDVFESSVGWCAMVQLRVVDVETAALCTCHVTIP